MCNAPARFVIKKSRRVRLDGLELPPLWVNEEDLLDEEAEEHEVK